ncbi:hypothetical protein GIB67_030003 [Kingdonia uniflora]|uniref:Aminotransferase-like plant mobile domain-containing protein n=1 Tax=Kingdonia uniflora TaxID=39325 RepID=A0A7J7MXV6_9MAGN|nr:hypothetical protein GIB67_030003 [Kingdonia uniflora]
MMGYLWFQTANDIALLGYLAAVTDLDKAAQYDWGSAILVSMYHGLDTAVTTEGAITGFSQLLELVPRLLFAWREGGTRPDPRWHIEWIWRHEMLPIQRLRDPPPMSSSYGVEELWYLTHVVIYVLYQAAMSIVVHDETSSHDESIMGRKDKRMKRDHPLGHYSIMQDYFKPNCTYEP